MNYSTEVKQKLLSIITKMDSYHWLFTKHPKTDLSRKKKWSFEEVMKFMLTMEGKALRDVTAPNAGDTILTATNPAKTTVYATVTGDSSIYPLRYIV